MDAPVLPVDPCDYVTPIVGGDGAKYGYATLRGCGPPTVGVWARLLDSVQILAVIFFYYQMLARIRSDWAVPDNLSAVPEG